MTDTHYSRKIEMPKTKRDGLANFVQMIINAAEAGDSREAMLKAVDLHQDITCGLYDDAMVDAKAANSAMAEARQKHVEDLAETANLHYLKGVADEKARIAVALGLT